MYSCGPLHMDKQRLDEQLEPTYNNSVPIQDVAWKTSQEQWMIEMGGKRGSRRSMLAVRHDDDDFLHDCTSSRNNIGIRSGFPNCHNRQLKKKQICRRHSPHQFMCPFFQTVKLAVCKPTMFSANDIPPFMQRNLHTSQILLCQRRDRCPINCTSKNSNVLPAGTLHARHVRAHFELCGKSFLSLHPTLIS